MINLDQMIAADKRFESGTVPDPKPKSKKPDDLSRIESIVTETSTRLWQYLGYVGLITPWHEMDEFTIHTRSLHHWLDYLDKNDIDCKTYCVLSFASSQYTKYEKLTALLTQKAHWAWLKKLRERSGSRESLNKVADFLLAFFQLQISGSGKAFLDLPSMVGDDPVTTGKCFILYNRISDRLKQLESLGVNWSDWLEMKFYNCLSFMFSKKEKNVPLSMVVNQNRLEPDLEELSKSDPWREIRRFLGLAISCEFSDGSVPKGWRPRIGMDHLGDIVRVTADGFYYLKDGSQYQGIRHYMSNKYFVIKCVPENFGNFKERWNDDRLVSSRPTWEEYDKWALYSGRWNENGEGLVMAKDVSWRTR